jgi:hypothetical protein
MKKRILVLGIFFTMVVTSTYANETKVAPRVLESFKKDFSSVQEVSWVAGSNFFQASFRLNEQTVFAYYNSEGELLSVARYLSSLQLPLRLLTDLKNDYSQYWISNLFEVNNSEGTQYFVTLENASTSLVLVARNGGNWKQYSKKEKV